MSEFLELINAYRIFLYFLLMVMMTLFFITLLWLREKATYGQLVVSHTALAEELSIVKGHNRDLRDANQRLNSKLNSSKARLRRAKKANHKGGAPKRKVEKNV